MRRYLVAGLSGMLLALLLLPAWGEVVGKTTAALDAVQVKTGETTLGDLVADAMRDAGKAEAALAPAGSVRPETLPAGDLTRERLAGVLVFPEEQVVVIELKGSEITQALERSLAFLPKPSTSLLQVSGMTVAFRSAAAAGQRVAEVTVGGAPLAPARTYRVAMPLSLAKGAMGYYRIFGVREVKLFGPTLKDAVASYVQATGTITPVSGRRLRDLSQPAAR